MLLNLKYENMLIVIQHDEVLSNAKTCYLKLKRVIQREKVLSTVKGAGGVRGRFSPFCCFW